MRRLPERLLPFALVLLLTAAPLAALAAAPTAGTGDPLALIAPLKSASLLAREQGRDLIAREADTPRIPASTMKLLTAFAALETWGRDHRFATEFYRDGQGWLWVRGYADPYLVSEELELMAAQLAALGVGRLAGIGLDDSFFAPEVEIAGRSASNNPYDAPVTALAANFNTVNLIRTGGDIRSAEPQTPLTPTARALGLAGAEGRQRINLRERTTALRHFGELLAARLAAAGVEIQLTEPPRIGTVPRDAKRLYRHLNSRPLAAMIEPMLKFSNNFIANALFLHLAQPRDRGQVDMAAARRSLTAFARERFGWRDFVIDDGAGLSRANRLSARQLVELLQSFAPYRDLLPVQEDTDLVRAKTGTLTGVSAYAGYARRQGLWEPFALLVNEPVDRGLRLRVARQLAR